MLRVFLMWCLVGELLIVLLRERKAHPVAILERLVIVPISFLFGAVLLAYALSLRTVNFDSQLLQLDLALFGFNPADVAGRIMHSVPYLGVLCAVVYESFPLIFGILIGTRNWRAVKEVVIATVVGVGFYVLIPARGPAFSGVPSAPTNAFPSMHTAWALFLWLHASRRWRPAAAVYAGITMLACLGYGEHYLIDLLAAVPLVLVVHHWSEVRKLIPTRSEPLEGLVQPPSQTHPNR